jgi:hypothetical protein
VLVPSKESQASARCRISLMAAGPRCGDRKGLDVDVDMWVKLRCLAQIPNSIIERII